MSLCREGRGGFFGSWFSESRVGKSFKNINFFFCDFCPASFCARKRSVVPVVLSCI